jgi:hypothetical protein
VVGVTKFWIIRRFLSLAGNGANSKQQAADNAAARQRLLEATLEERHSSKHLSGTPQANRLLAQEGFVHVFLDQETMNRVIQAIMAQGEYLGEIRGHERWGHQFEQPIGFRVGKDGGHFPLFYGEIKVKGGKYHANPRTRRPLSK